MHLLKTGAFRAFHDIQRKVKSYKKWGVKIRFVVGKRNYNKEF